MEAHDNGAKERRKYRRFKTPGEAFAVFQAPGPIVGQIVDISEGGLSILYIEGDEKPLEVVVFDLFTLDDDVKVNAISAVARSDHQLSGQNGGKADIVRRRGIEFIGLQEGQKEAVQELIRKQRADNGDHDA